MHILKFSYDEDTEHFIEDHTSIHIAFESTTDLIKDKETTILNFMPTICQFQLKMAAFYFKIQKFRTSCVQKTSSSSLNYIVCSGRQTT